MIDPERGPWGGVPELIRFDGVVEGWDRFEGWGGAR